MRASAVFTTPAWADKWDGAVHHTPIRGVTLAMNEPVGCSASPPDEYPLLGSFAGRPAVAVGNTSSRAVGAAVRCGTEFYTVLETLDGRTA